ncbi:hypothetical protein [Acinetobacter sp. ANC 4648]|uniref:hypothetical protein n=1 Tax=Acinetobacter sp. ANC 4648 TaxID=1977875 RepID=UPI000A345995|nr:hypothetical protein [Acinetobacter sp. ANC 4648]OTG83735.1 hypothetical protein B9T27_04280 [Acinetobacter sp. ANC 4648]
MKNMKILGLGCIILALTACQTTPRHYNGVTGYKIENKTDNSATLAYTLAGRSDRKLDIDKLQRACQKVLGPNKTYKISVLSTNEIINPKTSEQDLTGVKLGHSRTSFGLSNTPSLNNSEDYAMRQALETRPSTLHVIRYTCS